VDGLDCDAAIEGAAYSGGQDADAAEGSQGNGSLMVGRIMQDSTHVVDNYRRTWLAWDCDKLTVFRPRFGNYQQCLGACPSCCINP